MRLYKYIFISTFIIGLAIKPSISQSLETGLDTVSYCVGLMVAQSVQKQVGDIRYEAFMQGFKDLLEGGDRQFTDVEAQEYLNAFGAAKHKTQYEAQIAEGRTFLEQNASRDGVVVLENGIQYEVMSAGATDGPRPSAQDRVKVHYHGTHLSGEVFDSSVERGEPASFSVGGVIKGWTEVLQLMTVGSKWKVYIPEDLAYGSRGNGKILPYSTLIFEIELLEIQ